MVSPTPFFADRGCHIRIYQEARALTAAGHHVAICTYHLGDNIPGVEIHRIMNVPWYKKISAGPSVHKVYLDFLLLLKAMRLSLAFRPDVIHAHLHEGVFIGWVLSVLFRVPLVFDVQGRLTGEVKAHKFVPERSLRLRLVEYLEHLSYRLPGASLVNSQIMADHLQEAFHIHPESLLVVPDIDGDSYYPRTWERAALKQQLRIPPDKKLVVYLGLLTEYQGIDGLLEIIHKLTQTRKDLHFLIMGYPDVPHYERRCAELQIADYVTFTGRVRYRRIYEYLALGDIAVSPKQVESWEGNGKIYNYITANLPIVVFDYPLNREILGDCGVYARPKDLDSFAECILRVLDDPTLSSSIKERLQALRARVSWEHSTKLLTDLYTCLIKNHGKLPENVVWKSTPNLGPEKPGRQEAK